MVDFTVAICTYNGEKRLPDVLDKLRSQIGTEQISWEIIVVDNNSTDETARIVKEYQSKWPDTYPLQYCVEREQGLAFARRCAIREAKGDLVGFLDDDNLPYPNWVATAYSFGQAHPEAGAYGGQIHGKFEVEPPPGFERISRYFALIKGKHSYCYNKKYESTRKKMFPPGAGIVIRTLAWFESIPEHPQLPQTNEDLEMLSYIWQADWEIWFNPEMEIDHFIPKSRLEKDYLMRFFQKNGRLRYQVRMLGY
ncbi:MAG TPA: hormogonium polysaccharide biosynthesis glycosyltransferase HpsE, partial [Coleofasciculaceae cyanobacterium]